MCIRDRTYTLDELLTASQSNPRSLTLTGGPGWGTAPITPRGMIVDSSGFVWSLPAATPSDTQPAAPAGTTGAAEVAGVQTAPPAGGTAAAIDPREVAVEVLHEVPLPDIQVRMNPDTGLVALPAWFWVEGYDGGAIPRSRTVDVPPVVEIDVPLNVVPANDARRRGRTFTVEVTIRPTSYDWSFGDGGSSVSRSLGRRYPQESDVQHTYESSSLRAGGTFPVRLTVAFAAEFRVDGGPAQTLPPTQRTYSAMYRVQEIQSVLVSR